MAEDCVFCRIISGELPTAKVYEDAATIAFLPIEPATKGHTLVVPKRHSRNLFDITESDLTSVIHVAKVIARRQRDRLACEGIGLYQSNEPAGFQTVFHFHLHVVPRWQGDRVREAWHAEPADLAEVEQIASRLRD